MPSGGDVSDQIRRREAEQTGERFSGLRAGDAAKNIDLWPAGAHQVHVEAGPVTQARLLSVWGFRP